ncbi:hypothetical protein Bca52824_031834 [Brassica carinata]|uniref:PPM-type phosphatase domain-containing protein n=1 Tax=Brassica carinata TaxID=52824 RepID=A0A8X7SBL3_BRACI|nr:hypothetical protein Bca52824_031834 [Brassica carinata]
MEKPNHKHAAESFPREDLISPPSKKVKKSEETGCDNARIPSGAGDEKQEIPVGGEEAIAALGNRAAEEGNSSCISEEKKGFVSEADVAEDKGARHAMEDVSVVLSDASLDFPGKLRCGHFAIYDGHGGRLAAEFAKKHLHLNVLSAALPRLTSQSFRSFLVDPNVSLLFQLNIRVAKKAILDGFRKADELLLQESVSGGWQDGATAVCVWIVDQKFGVIATPDIHAFELTEKENFMILGCDGLWEVFGLSDAVGFVQKLLKLDGQQFFG